MKSEHRHEIQENDLTKYAERSLGWFKTYGNLIMVAVCVVSIGASIAIYWQRVNESRREHAWSELAVAHSAVEFQSIVNDPVLSKSSAAPWAMIQEGEHRLQEGIRLMFTDRERGKRELEAGVKAFDSILEVKPPVAPQIRERALFGLARSQESLSDGKLENAIATYQKLLTEFPDSLFKKMAEGRVTELKRKDASQFYAWFSKQKPTTSTTRLPADQKASDSTKKGSSTKATSTKDQPTVELPAADVPILDAPDAKTSDPKLPATGTPAEKKSSDKGAATLPLPAPSKSSATKADTVTPPAKSEPAKSEPAKTESKSNGKADATPKKSP